MAKTSRTTKPSKKAPGAPKRFRSSFILFFTNIQQEIAKDLPEGQLASAPVISKLASKRWKALSVEERKHWDEKAEEEKERYIKETKDYKGPWQVPNTRAKKDPSSPKRNPSAFLLYANQNRTKLRKKYPELKNTEISRMLGSGWHLMSKREKDPFFQQEAKERGLYLQRVAEWKQKKKQKQKEEEVSAADRKQEKEEEADKKMPSKTMMPVDIISPPRRVVKKAIKSQPVDKKASPSASASSSASPSASSSSSSSASSSFFSEYFDGATKGEEKDAKMTRSQQQDGGSNYLNAEWSETPLVPYPVVQNVESNYLGAGWSETPIAYSLPQRLIPPNLGQSVVTERLSMPPLGNNSPFGWSVLNRTGRDINANFPCDLTAIRVKNDTNLIPNVNFVEESSCSQEDFSSHDGISEDGVKGLDKGELKYHSISQLHQNNSVSSHKVPSHVPIPLPEDFKTLRQVSDCDLHDWDHQNNSSITPQDHDNIMFTTFRDDSNPATATQEIGNEVSPHQLSTNREIAMLSPSHRLSFDAIMNDEPDSLKEKEAELDSLKEKEADLELDDDISMDPLGFDLS